MAATRPRLRAALACSAVLMLGGCAEDMSDLRQFVEETKQRPGGKIEPLPEFPPYQGFAYDPADLRNPFEPRAEFSASNEKGEEAGSGLQPDRDRPKEPLEQFPLDSLSMVGTLTREGQRRGLVRDPDGVIHRVLPGNHMGQNFGRIVTVGPDQIQVVEIVRDGQGGWMERDASLALPEQE